MAGTDVYKVIAGCVVPRPIGFLSTVSREGVRNAAPYSFFNAMSHLPPMVIASIAPVFSQGNRMKDTLRNILDTNEFVVNIVDEAIAKAQDDCSEEFPPEVDEIAASGLTSVPGTVVRAPRIVEAPVNLECRLIRTITIPELDCPHTLVLGQVVMMHVREDILLPNGRIDPVRLAAVGRMTGNSYIRTRDLFTLEHNTFDILPPGSTPA